MKNSVEIRNLSKIYEVYDRPEDRFKQAIVPRLKNFFGITSRPYYREFTALRNINFDIQPGETVGIIGRNGSGKSTLLKIICGTLRSTAGTVKTHGRVAALLELGSGFNPEFTGRENVFMNAAILGLSHSEILEKFDEIVSFANIGEFIDQPVRNYSSGMVVRLAFAVQSQVDPDILIVDEALAVGDAKFQAKCFERLRTLKEKGTSILLVTHSGEQIVTHCSKAILLDKGNQIEIGEPRDVVNKYHNLMFGTKNNEVKQCKPPSEAKNLHKIQAYDLSKSADLFSLRQGYNIHEYRWGDGKASILDFSLESDEEIYPNSVKVDEEICLRVAIKFNKDLLRPIFGFTVKTKEGVTIYGANSETLECINIQNSGAAGSIILVQVKFVCRLGPGDYFISVGVATREAGDIIPHDRRYDAIHLRVDTNSTMFGLADLKLNMTTIEISE